MPSQLEMEQGINRQVRIITTEHMDQQYKCLQLQLLFLLQCHMMVNILFLDSGLELLPQVVIHHFLIITVNPSHYYQVLLFQHQ